jgi:hypothetical protein
MSFKRLGEAWAASDHDELGNFHVTRHVINTEKLSIRSGAAAATSEAREMTTIMFRKSVNKPQFVRATPGFARLLPS